MMAQRPLPKLAPGLVDPASMAGDQATIQACAVLDQLNAAITNGDFKALEQCFYAEQAYWRDQVALTYHIRTFRTPGVIASSLLETTKLRKITAEGIQVDGSAAFLPVTPVLQFIDCPIVFNTGSPEGTCRGKVLFLPVVQEGTDSIIWRIWILSTRLETLGSHVEDQESLKAPRRELDNAVDFETEVLIIGGGNSAITLAARLKALGVENVMVDRNENPGDNWALRYDCMRFHLLTSACELPFMRYDESLQSPHLLTRDDLALHVQRYVETLNLNLINSATIQSTIYNEKTSQWSITFQTPSGQRKATSKQLVLATGIGSNRPRIPEIADSHLYKGTALHSAHYKNANLLREQGVKSAMIIGSANTAFDIIEDCHAAGLETTMNARSPTYLLPLEYICQSLAAYEVDVDAADKRLCSLPSFVDAQIGRGVYANFASKQPARYTALEAAGFQVMDSCHPNVALLHNLLERAGGHYIDIGGTKLIEEGKVRIKAGVEPVAYTETGLLFSDGSRVETDAVVWCTGFSDTNALNTAAEILGGSVEYGSMCKNDSEGGSHILGPHDIASRLDATWGVDDEGEIRGMWKRHLNVDNFWIMGGFAQPQRWHSRNLALQIKAAVEGVLPPAYRDTPLPVNS
ncbi:monooxygenase [Penicillium malachiteum]|uniref:monooxygenase n=1 Tax=Penicillium malachiteum TaxID=1324776 RepID=UPI002548F5AD|nr:monooxygenase [Penicillium malachiteum]KAJ5737022.1 monooxygenase [Penicillium malachiteum]